MSLKGIAVNQLEAPFSQARSIALRVLLGREIFNCSSFSFMSSSFSSAHRVRQPAHIGIIGCLTELRNDLTDKGGAHLDGC